MLYNFGGGCVGDGSNPAAGLLEGSRGALYGTTYYTGTYATNQPIIGYGTVFKLNKDGSGYNVLDSFAGGGVGDGVDPACNLVEGRDGALYGTTLYGGLSTTFGPGGTVFRLNKDGTGYSVLHRFGTNSADGTLPSAGLVAARDGFLYGTTLHGGNDNAGTVSKLNEDGSGYIVLHSFAATNGIDGSLPVAGLIQGSDGALYGTTRYGGTSNLGTVFRLSLAANPALAMVLSNTTISLSWPFLSTGFVLESTPSLVSPDWQPAPETAVSTNGQWHVTVTTTQAHRYFRLHEP